MVDIVRQMYEQRKRDEYVDPEPSRQEAIAEIKLQLPETLQKLKEHGYPNLKKWMMEARVNGEKRIVWAYIYTLPREGEIVEKVVEGKRKKVREEIPARQVALLIDDDGVSPLAGTIVEGAQGKFRTISYDGMWPPHLWGIVGFLKELAKPPKRNVWDD